jgi:hypothetical protein
VGSSITSTAEQRLRDLDHLLLGDPERIDAPIGIDGDTHFRQAALGRFTNTAAVDPAAARRFVPQQNVLGDRQLRNEAQLLIDRRDAERLGVARRFDGGLAPLDLDGPPVAAVRAAQDLHQRRLARAVFPEQHVHFAMIQRESHPVERDHARKRFADIPHHQQRQLRHGDEFISLGWMPSRSARAPV